MCFQDAVESYLKLTDEVRNRHHDEKADDGTEHFVFFINHHRSHSEMCFGEFLSFEPGKAPKGIDLNAKGVSAELVDLLQGIPADQRRQVIDAASYFGVWKNHVVLMASRSLGVRQFETYVNGVMRKAKIIPAEAGFQFVKQIYQEHEPELKKVRAITIGSPLFERVAVPVLQDQDKARGKSKFMVVPMQFTSTLLEALMGTGLNKFEPADIVDGAMLSMRVEIRYSARKADSESKILEHLTRSLRDVPEHDVQVELRGKGVLKGKNLFLHHTVPITHNDGSPDSSELFTKMRDWLNLLAKQNAI